MTQPYKVKDIGLADQGRLQIEWAESRMPVLMALRRKYEQQRPLKGMRIAGCLHVTKETAVLVRTLRAAGASIFAWHGLSVDDFYWCIERTLDLKPTLTLDDGADLIMTVHTKHPELATGILGGTEETTTGVHRLRAMAADKKLLYPVLAINDAETKWDFDNVYGTGQSTLDGILRATSVLIAGKVFVTAGYGHCGRGLTLRAKGLGANTVITEVDPLPALKATLEGHRVLTMDEAAKIGDIFVTATGMRDVIRKRHFESMKDGAIVCNTGHYDVEINIPELEALARSHRTIRENCDEYRLDDGRRIYLLARGRLVNLAAAEGHPSEVMDMSFANQFMGMMHMAQAGRSLEPKVYDITTEQDQEIGRVKLETMGNRIDELTEEQKRYATDYLAGT
jgi:adenosylhomocysteinase